MDPAGAFRSEQMGRRLLLGERLDQLKIGQFDVALVLEDERLGAVACHHPGAPGNSEPLH